MIFTVGINQQYSTIKQALTAAKAYAGQPVTLSIFPGFYHEKLEITQPYLTLEGISAESTIITYNQGAKEILPNGEKRGTFRTYTLLVDAPNVTLRNLTIENSAGPGKTAGQAIALYAEGEGITVDHCRLLGHQDTLFTGPLPPSEGIPGGFRGPKEFAPRINGRQYYKNCYICGSVDFIFGSATAYFENCTIESLDEGTGYVTAGSSPDGQRYGYVFNYCRFVSSNPDQTAYLGRPWRDYAKVVVLNSEINSHIHPDGWDDWGKHHARQTVYFAEYKNYGPGASGNRPDWIHLLTDEEALLYSKEQILKL